MTKFYHFILLTVLGLSTVACQNHVDMPNYPEIRFNKLSPFVLSVGKVEIVEEAAESKLEYLFPITPVKAIRGWAADRIQAVGDNKSKLAIIIKKAEITERKIPKPEGWQNVADSSQTEYKVDIRVAFEVYKDDMLVPQAELTIELYKAKSIPDNVTLSEREQLLYQITKDLITSLNQEFEKEASNYFGNIMYQE
jgi:hypothetical protein